MFLVLVFSTIFVLVSAADEANENNAVNEIGRIIMEESQKGAKTLAGFWDKNDKIDQQSIDGFLKGLEGNVFGKVKNNVAALVKNSLGKGVSQPESTDMYKVLRNIIQKYTTELTLGQATTISTNQQIKLNVPRKGGDDKLSKTIASLYNEIANKNVTAEEKSNLLGKSQKQIDAFIKMNIKAENNSKSKVVSRSGSFFYNYNNQQHQQEKSSSSVAHKLTQQMMNNMCAPQPTYTNNCHMVCPQCPCTQCVSGNGHGQAINYAGSSGGHNSYRHTASMDSRVSSSLTESGHSTGLIRNNGFGSNGLIGNGYSGTMGETGVLPGSVYIGSGHNSDIRNSGGLIGGGLSGSAIVGGNSYGTHGSSITYSGSAHNSHSIDSSMTGSLNSHNTGYDGAHGTSLGDVKGSYSGISNLWSLNKAGSNSANSYDGSTFDSGHRLGGYDGTSYVGGGGSHNQHPGSLNNIHGLGLGSVGGGGQYREKYSSSNRKSSSSKSDSSSNHLTYENSGNLW